MDQTPVSCVEPIASAADKPTLPIYVQDLCIYESYLSTVQTLSLFHFW